VVLKMWGWLSELLASLLKSLGFYEKTAKLLVLGLDNAGKTTLLHKLSSNSIVAFAPTERAKEEFFELEGISFRAWDLGGHEAVRHVWNDFFPDCHGIVFLVDAADADRFPEACEEIQELCKVPELTDTPIAIFFNKSDRKEAASNEALVKALKLEMFAGSSNVKAIRVFRTSCVEGSGYVEGFQWLSEFVE
jgi:GTP-binding protein SAR1